MDIYLVELLRVAIILRRIDSYSELYLIVVI